MVIDIGRSRGAGHKRRKPLKICLQPPSLFIQDRKGYAYLLPSCVPTILLIPASTVLEEAACKPSQSRLRTPAHPDFRNSPELLAYWEQDGGQAFVWHDVPLRLCLDNQRFEVHTAVLQLYDDLDRFGRLHFLHREIMEFYCSQM